MKSIGRNSKNIIKIQKRQFAGKAIDPNLKELDIAFIGSNHVASVLKYMQHTNFKGTMGAFNANPASYNQHQYEYLIHGNIQSYKYLATSFGGNYDTAAALHISEKVVDINPAENKLTDSRGQEFTYKALVLNTGCDQNPENDEFINKWVQDGLFGENRVFVHSNRNMENNERNRRIFSMHKDGDLIVYLPEYPSGREAYDAWYLGMDTYFSWGLQAETIPRGMKIRVITPNNNLFRFPFANEVVMDEIQERSLIETHFGWKITNVEVEQKGPQAVSRHATFKNVETGEEMRLRFGTLLATPSNKKRACFNSNDLTDENGQVTVNPYSLQHTKYPNVFAFGDCANVNTTKSFYATLNQGVVVRNNLTDYLAGNEFKAVYQGYSSFAVNHSFDRQWIFSHYYNNQPSFGNFYVPRFLGLFAYKFKCSLEKFYFSKIFAGKMNYGWPFLMKNKYFRPLNENRYLKTHGITREQIMIHSGEAPILSFQK